VALHRARNHVPDLAGSLSNLALRYSEVGAHKAAVAPSEEAVTLYRDLAAENPAYLSHLVTSSTNLERRRLER